MSGATALAQAEKLAEAAARLNSDLLAFAGEARMDAGLPLKEFLGRARAVSASQGPQGAADLSIEAAAALRGHKKREALLLKLADRREKIEEMLRDALAALADVEEARDALPRFTGVAKLLVTCGDRIDESLATERHAIDQWRAAREVIAPTAKRNAAFRRLGVDAVRAEALRTDMDGAVARMLAASAKVAAKP